MLPIHPRRIVIALHTIDYRKHWNGLLGECYRLGFDPYAGDCVVFVKKDRTQLRALSGDARGLFVVARRFDGGSLGLSWAFSDAAKTREITMAEVSLLLEGASFTVHRRVRQWRNVCASSETPVKRSEDSKINEGETRDGGKGYARSAAASLRDFTHGSGDVVK